MLLADAKCFIGKVCAIRWHDRTGNENSTISTIYDVTFVPLYGGYLVTEREDIRLDRVIDLEAAAEAPAPPAAAAA